VGINYFRSRAALLDAEEVKNDMASQLLNDAKRLLQKTKVDLKHQTQLKPADRRIFQVKRLYLYIIHYIYR